MFERRKRIAFITFSFKFTLESELELQTGSGYQIFRLRNTCTPSSSHDSAINDWRSGYLRVVRGWGCWAPHTPCCFWAQSWWNPQDEISPEEKIIIIGDASCMINFFLNKYRYPVPYNKGLLCGLSDLTYLPKVRIRTRVRTFLSGLNKSKNYR